MGWIEIGLFAVAGFAGHAGFMMLTGFIPGPPGRWLAATGGTLVLISIQALVLLAYSRELFHGQRLDDVDEEDASA